MGRYALKVSTSGTKVIGAFRRATGMGIASIRDRIDNRKVVAEFLLGKTDHNDRDEVAERLLALLNELQEIGAAFELFEMPASLTGPVDELAVPHRRIEVEVLHNGLEAREERMREMQEEIDEELGEDGD